MQFPVRRFIGRLLVCAFILTFLVPVFAHAAIIRVAWSPSSCPDLAGYRVRYGTDGVQFPNQVIVPEPGAVSRSIGGLTVGTTYYFVVQAYDISGNISSASNVAACEALPWDREAEPPVVPVIVSLQQPGFEIGWNVADFGGVAAAGLEVSRVDEPFDNPNGTHWDPEHCCYSRVLNSPSGTITLDAGLFQGPGLYQLRVAALDAAGTIICCFSDSAGLEVIAGAPALPDLVLTGPGPGPDNPPQVRLFDPLAGFSEPLLDFTAYGVSRYGVNVAVGDLTGDGRPELVTGAGPGAMFGPQVRVFDVTGATMHADFFAYGTMRWGVKCTVGDIDGDQVDEIVTTPGPGEAFGPHIRGWDNDGTDHFQAMGGVSFMAYGTVNYGANAACGDIDGDGIDEIITGAGPGPVFGPHVRAFNVDGAAATAIPAVSFFAYDTNRFGVNVSCGDIDGDGFDEIVTGAGPGEMFASHVRAFDYDAFRVAAMPGVSFFAYGQALSYGVNVACGDVDGDGVDEIVTAPGPGEGDGYTALVRGWNCSGGTVNPIGGIDFPAYGPEQTFGARVAVARGVR